MNTSLFSRGSAVISLLALPALCQIILGAILWTPTAAKAETTIYSGGSALTSGSGPTYPSANAIPITASGTYYLTQDIVSSQSSGTAISVSVSNVTIDLNGHTISNSVGLSANPGSSFTCNGINVASSPYGVSNVTIRNGTITGFYRGVMFTSSDYTLGSPSYGHLIENLNLVKNLYTGAYLSGTGCRAYRCRVVQTGGTTASGGTLSYYGILLLGANHTVEDCDIISRAGANTMYGIYVNSSNYTVISGPGSTYYSSFIVNNRLSSIPYGIYSASGGSVKTRDNLTINIPTGNAYTLTNSTAGINDN